MKVLLSKSYILVKSFERIFLILTEKEKLLRQTQSVEPKTFGLICLRSSNGNSKGFRPNIIHCNNLLPIKFNYVQPYLFRIAQLV